MSTTEARWRQSFELPSTNDTARRMIDRINKKRTRYSHSGADDVFHRDLLFGYGLSGRWFSEETALADIPKPQHRLLKRHLAQLVVTDHLDGDLFWPESPRGSTRFRTGSPTA